MAMLSPRRMSPPILCAVVAIAGGLAAGMATVNGLHQKVYGPAEAPSLFARAEAATFGEEDGRGRLDDSRGGSDSDTVAQCDRCSERDLGYRWAVLAAISVPDQCPSDSWGFRRGCLDYVGGI